MSYLLDFVRTFTNEEMATFARLDVIGKEELVRDEYVRHAKDSVFDEAKLPGKLQLSSSHFDKINSVLLDKTIAALFGSDYGKIFSNILNKGLSALMLHELKILEKKVTNRGDNDAIRSFYLAGFEGLRNMFHPNYNSKLTHQIGAKYLQSLGTEKTIADESYVAMLALYGDIVAAAYSGNEGAFKPTAEKLLGQWEKKIAGHKNATASFYTAFARATFYKNFTEDAQGFLRANEQALNAFRESTNSIDKKYEGVVLCELGFGNIALNQFKTAEHYYADAFAKFPDTVGKSIYQAGNYFCVTLLTQNFADCKRIFDIYLKPKILPSTNPSAVFDIYMLGAWGHLHQHQFERAFEYLTKLKQYGKAEITLLGQTMVRQLESACFYLSGDIVTASITVNKNVRFLQKHKHISVNFDYYLQYTQIVGKLIKMEQQKLRAPAKLKEQIESLPSGLYQICNAPLLSKFNALTDR